MHAHTDIFVMKFLHLLRCLLIGFVKFHKTSSWWWWFLPRHFSELLPWWFDGWPCHWSQCAVWSSSSLLLTNSEHTSVNTFWFSAEWRLHQFFVFTWEEGIVDYGMGDIGSCVDLCWHVENISSHRWLVFVLRQSAYEWTYIRKGLKGFWKCSSGNSPTFLWWW